MSVGSFKAGIGALVWDPITNTYLLLKRSMAKDFAAGAWECVTGRVDQGEGFEDALHREVREETGLVVEPTMLLGTTHFHRGEERPENELLGVIYCCTIVKAERTPENRPMIRISPEHDAFRWVTTAQAAEMLSANNPSELWLLRVISKADYSRKHLPEELINDHRRHGFELDT